MLLRELITEGPRSWLRNKHEFPTDDAADAFGHLGTHVDKFPVEGRRIEMRYSLWDETTDTYNISFSVNGSTRQQMPASYRVTRKIFTEVLARLESFLRDFKPRTVRFEAHVEYYRSEPGAPLEQEGASRLRMYQALARNLQGELRKLGYTVSEQELANNEWGQVMQFVLEQTVSALDENSSLKTITNIARNSDHNPGAQVNDYGQDWLKVPLPNGSTLNVYLFPDDMVPLNHDRLPGWIKNSDPSEHLYFEFQIDGSYQRRERVTLRDSRVIMKSVAGKLMEALYKSKPKTVRFHGDFFEADGGPGKPIRRAEAYMKFMKLMESELNSAGYTYTTKSDPTMEAVEFIVVRMDVLQAENTSKTVPKPVSQEL